MSIKLDGTDKRTHLKLRYSQEAIVSPDESMVAFSELHNAYVAALPTAGAPVDFDPNSATVAFQQLTKDGGEWVTWSHDGQYLSWGFGTEVHRLPVNELDMSGKAEPGDASDDGILVLPVSINGSGQYAHGDTSGDLGRRSQGCDQVN